MDKFFERIFKFLLMTLMVAGCCFGRCLAARTAPVHHRVIGIVADSVSGEGMPHVNVYNKKAKIGTTTDSRGIFIVHIPAGTSLDITSLGYTPATVRYTGGHDTLRVLMSPMATDLNEVVVKPKKEKYSKKNNRAVELIKRVREDRKRVDPRNADYYSYDQYDKMVIGINNFNAYKPAEDGQVKGRHKDITKLVDTAIWTGKRVLDVSMKEKYSTRLTTSSGADKRIVTAQRTNGIDKGLDENYTRTLFEDMLRETDVYDNDISLMRSKFVSPLSAIGPDFYKYAIEDTVLIGNDRCVELSFAPHNPESPGFNGKIYIPADDSVKWVRRVMMRLPKAANVNYIESLYVSQTFRKDSVGYVHKTLDDVVIELHLVGSFGQGYITRQSRTENHSYEKREDLKQYYTKVGDAFLLDDASDQNSGYWTGVRLIPLSAAERELSRDDNIFRNLPFINFLIKATELVVKGYVKTSGKSYFDIGPIGTFLSSNDTEGFRLSVGGMTTANLSKHLFARGYVAYGFKDHKWKYSGELEYSFTPKKYHSREFPINSLRATYRYDINNIGQHYMTNSESNIISSIHRMESELTVYERDCKLEYNIEWRNHLSFNATLCNKRQEESAYVKFVRGDGTSVPSYSQNSLRLELRYAPGEKFMQTYDERFNINRDGLVLRLAHTFGPKNLFGSEYTINLTEFCIDKRFWFSAFGHVDLVFKAAKLWNQVQFPALLWQNANISYTMQRETFSLLNPMEFAMDQYVSLDFSYNMNGLIFNRIPLIKKLKLREVVTFKGFAGHLSRKNNPEFNENLFRFPDPTVTRPMGKTPYMEVGVGIENILTFIRIDYVWRLTYRDTPGAPNSGLRFALQFSF